jgi:N-methylhydantoinase A
VVIPQAGAVLSARGALMSDLSSEYAAAFFTGSQDFDHAGAQQVLDGLRARCEQFAERNGMASEAEIEFVAEARYRHQVWQLDVRLREGRLAGTEDLAALVEDFHAIHDEVYAVRDERAEIEVVNLRARVNCPLRGGGEDAVALEQGHSSSGMRSVYFSGIGAVNAAILRLEAMSPGAQFAGPAIVESSFTTIVLNPGASAERTASGSLAIVPGAVEPATSQQPAKATSR